MFMIAGYASSAPASIIHVRGDKPNGLRDECSIPMQCDIFNLNSIINAVRYKPRKRNSERMDRHSAVKQSNEVSKPDWPEYLTLSGEYPAYSNKLINMPTKFESMWDRHLASAKPVKHQLGLDETNEPPIYSATYSAEPKARGFKSKEVNQIFSVDVIKLARGPHLLSLSPRRAECFVLESTTAN